MTSKGIRHFTICLFAVTLLASFISVSLSVSQQEIPLDAPQTIEEGRGFQFEKIEFRILCLNAPILISTPFFTISSFTEYKILCIICEKSNKIIINNLRLG